MFTLLYILYFVFAVPLSVLENRFWNCVKTVGNHLDNNKTNVVLIVIVIFMMMFLAPFIVILSFIPKLPKKQPINPCVVVEKQFDLNDKDFYA